MCAAVKGHDTVVEVLLREGADVQASTSDGWTALMLAALDGHVGVVETIIGAQAHVNAKRANGWNALMYAALRGWTGAVEALLRAGAPVNEAKSSGFTPLMLAAQKVGISTDGSVSQHPSALVRAPTRVVQWRCVVLLFKSCVA